MDESRSVLQPDELKDAQIAALVVVGLLLFVFEAYIPRPLPWLKFGLANIATIVALYWLGWREAIVVSLLRILVGSFFTGNLLTPGFFLALSGGSCALVMMILLKQTGLFGIVAVSIGGAIGHNTGQLALAAEWLFNNPVLWHLLPYLLITALLTGSLIGWMSYELLKRLAALPPTPEAGES